MRKKGSIVFIFSLMILGGLSPVFAQPALGLHWLPDSKGYYQVKDNKVEKVMLPGNEATTVISAAQLTPADSAAPLRVENFFFSADGKELLLFTNSKKVWRQHTRGDYWLLNTTTNALRQVGKDLPAASLMFAKISPDATKVAYVSNHNIYVEDVQTQTITPVTKDGTDRMINGTFDWVYEEEFGAKDGFRWSPDSKTIAYWKIDATKIRNFLLIDNTDSLYSFTKPVEYPKAGEDPSACYLYTVTIADGKTTKMDVPGDAVQHYIPRMEWAANSTQLVLQQLNRKQNESKVFYCDAATGAATEIYSEKDAAWIDTKDRWSSAPIGWEWVKNGSAFLWVSEKDGWRHIYLVSRDGKTETLLTKGDYDITTVEGYDDKTNYAYFIASPDNATQRYLYRVKMTVNAKAERLSPATQPGTHEYDVSTNGMYAKHNFSNANTPPVDEIVLLPTHKVIVPGAATTRTVPKNPVQFFKVTTDDNVTMDGWMVLPTNFDSTKKYPVVFFVYTEPGGATVNDKYGVARSMYVGNMADDGYIYMSIDGRGTPVPKGAAWRKAIYKKVGALNVYDQAMAAKKILQWKYVDTSRVAVWGWSGGGSTTLGLLFKYPEIYKTGIAIAPVASQLSYDNVYEERYMGLPQENMADYVAVSPITYAKNLRGNLLVVHGTGDDNVHYQNTELLINELVKYNRQFSLMSYPNRTHSISEGSGTSEHLRTLYTQYLREHCAPGGR